MEKKIKDYDRLVAELKNITSKFKQLQVHYSKQGILIKKLQLKLREADRKVKTLELAESKAQAELKTLKQEVERWT